MGWWEISLLSALLFLSWTSLQRLALRRLPPGPPPLPFIGNLLFFLRSGPDFLSALDKLFSSYGPIISLHRPSFPIIMVSDRAVAHQMLVQMGAVFADRPPQSPALRIISADQCQISGARYGPRWRALRRNLTSEVARARLCEDARRWALREMMDRLRGSAAGSDGVVVPKEAIQYAMFCLLVFLCFGEKLDEETVRGIERAQRDALLFVRKLSVFDFAPQITRYVFWRRWNYLLQLRQRQREIFLPLINSHRQKKTHAASEDKNLGSCYVDSLLDLNIPENGGRKLTNEEIVSLCSEFLNAGTDTTSTALEWIMANITMNTDIQEKLAVEVGEATSEEELQSKPYLKAVVMEGLRRHPPGHFVLPHAATSEAVVGGYTIPKGTPINFAVGRMSRDKEAWHEPLEFRPERFLEGGEGIETDITGNRKIEMMPFGAGRRICPGMGLALLHLEYFVGNLVREFKWELAEGKKVDLSEKMEFTVVMRDPLRCRISPRR